MPTGHTIRSTSTTPAAIYLNPHDLRHTDATILLSSHKRRAYVREQLGHHSIKITVDIYGHGFPGVGRENLDNRKAVTS